MKPFSIRRAIALLLMIGTSLVPAPSFAQPSRHVLAANAHLSGESQKLVELGKKVTAMTCRDTECRLPTSTTWFTISTPGQHTMRVRLTRVGFPRNVQRTTEFASIDDTPTRPILLRALATIRHADENGRPRTVPIAGTLFRDDSQTVLEFAVPQIGGRRAPDNLRNIIVRAALSDIAGDTSHNARAKQVPSFAFSNRTCSLHEPVAPSPKRSRTPSRSAPPSSSPVTLKVFYVGTDYDPQYATRTACSSASACNNQILSVVNQAAVYYESQFAATLDVPRQFGPTSVSASTNAEDLLDAFSAYNRANRNSIVHNGKNTTSDQVDLFQLYSGKDLASNVIGLAYVGVLCPNVDSGYASMLVQYVSDAVNQIIVAHETGHTLGANHTVDGSGIMGSTLSNPVPSSFSAQSVSEISGHISTYYGECRGGTRDVTATPAPTSTPAPGATATPTPTGGGGTPGSGGTDPKLAPVTLGLTASQSKTGLVTMKATATTARLCTLTIRAATSGDAAITGKIVTQFEPLSSSTTIEGRVPFRVKTQNGKPTYIYVYAQHTCADGTILERSSVKKINPNKITVKNARAITASSWISKLSKGIS